MKTRLLFFFLLASSSLLAQLRGQYCHDYGVSSECITFLDSSQFEYEHKLTNGSNYGKGKYILRNDSLILDFGTDSSGVRSNCRTEIQPLNYPKSKEVVLDVHYYEAHTGEPILFAVIYIDGMNKSAMTDIDGFARLRVPADTTVTLKLKTVGYATCEVNLYCDKSYRIKVHSIAPQPFSSRNKLFNRRFEYAFKKTGEQTIELKSHESSPYTRFTKSAPGGSKGK